MLECLAQEQQQSSFGPIVSLAYLSLLYSKVGGSDWHRPSAPVDSLNKK